MIGKVRQPVVIVTVDLGRQMIRTFKSACRSCIVMFTGCNFKSLRNINTSVTSANLACEQSRGCMLCASDATELSVTLESYALLTIPRKSIEESR